MPSPLLIRPALPAEAPQISALAPRSKGFWGYDQDFLDACRDDLTIDPSWCDGIRLLVAERDGALLGYVRVTGDPPVGELSALFVDPSAIGTGVGRRLLAEGVGLAGRLGLRELTIDADPQAEGFYLRAGAVRTGWAESSVFAGRMLPLLRLAVGPTG